MRERRPVVRQLPALAVLLLLLFFSFVPIILMLSVSLRESLFVYLDFWAMPWPPYFGNYTTALFDLLPAIGRTMYLLALSIVGITLLACLSAYAFARLPFFGRNMLFMLVIVLLTIPGVLQLTSNFILAERLHLRNSLEGLALFYIGGGQVFSIFLLRSFFQAQPEELFESARIEGASEWRCIRSLAIPLAMPVLITIAILNFISIYNDLIFPLLMLNKPNVQTISIMLQNYNPMPQSDIESLDRPQIGVMAAGYTVASIPLLVLFLSGMKYFIQGMTSGAIKS